MLDPRTRIPWVIVFGSALILEAIALYFQYGMGLNPCVLCVYQRSAVLGIAIGSLIGALYPARLILRLAGYLSIAGSAVLGLHFASQHVAVLGGESFDCSFLPNFPTWLPLHEWFPPLFQPTGMCDEIGWLFLGLTMPEVMVGVFTGYLASIAYVFIADLVSYRWRIGK
jgi:disulfide bond formation protein DsbB